MWGVIGALGVALAVFGWWTLDQSVSNKLIEISPPAALRLDGIPELTPNLPTRMAAYQADAVRLYGWDAAGQGLVVSKSVDGHDELFRLSEPDAELEQITVFEATVSNVSLNPHPSIDDVLYLKDTDGDEQFQIFLSDGQNGVTKQISEDRGQYGGLRWSNRGDRFVYYSNSRNGRDWDVYLSTRENPQEAQPIIQGGGVWIPLEWGPGDRVLLLYNLSRPQNPFFMHDTRSELTFPLFPEVRFQDYGMATWARDGKGVYVIGTTGGDFRKLFYIDWLGGQITSVTDNIPWDIQQIAVSPDGSYVVFVANEDGISRLYQLNIDTHEFERIDGLPQGQIQRLSFSRNAYQLAIDLNTANSPSAIHVFDFITNEWTVWLDSAPAKDVSFAPELIHYPTFDAVDGITREIPAFYYAPDGDGPFPTLIYLHGGPAAQHTPTYSALFQYLVNELGIAVVAPNVRGSTGYGWRYSILDNLQKRNNVFRDISHLIDWVEAQPQLDSSRIAVMGESYGGFLALGAMAFYSERLIAGVSMAGISNLRSFLNSRSGFNQSVLISEFGDPLDNRNRVFLDSISPLNSVRQITSPLFIAQGLNDARVPASEAEQMVSALRDQGNEVWYLLAEDEGHGFRNPANQRYFDSLLAQFLKTFLFADR
jgi:acetyl esterase/lipase